ncbi:MULTISPECIES: hypothetical protein [unclassified Marinobacter]|uniref:hypothetical protein n=1 Tax=unclassified Marinobacter TaxID=83889 RepID=UPI0020108930|nr:MULTISPECIES: hypothetical protein [unclassified Marinobacter]MCL1488430.1 hypothetical protein [Marinobacter sp.]UQG57124.1 hypothetical protein MIH16_05620 [Marinobacter sp. M4C]UQG65928.1 hypothetical protein MIH17_05620 [Marinobacter sp. M2C]UQG70208.1 hypothetical protein MIH19_05615 [Marinobacter sp. M1C]
MQRQITPMQAVNELIATLETRDKLEDDLRDWLLHGFKLCRAGSVRTVDEGLGLAVGQGKAPELLRNAWRREERNRLICGAASKLAGLKKCQRAMVISHSISTGVPEVENHEARILLMRLRRLCTDDRGNTTMALHWKSVQDIIKRETP